MYRREFRATPFLWLIGFTLLISVPAWAQEIVPRVEVFAGYSYASIDPARDVNRLNSNGWQGSISYNVNRFFGATADVGGHYGEVKRPFGLANAVPKINAHEYLFGPRITGRISGVTVFGHALFGFAHTSHGSYNITSLQPGPVVPVLGVAQNKFAMAYGTGVDIRLRKNLAIRPFQVDYLPIRRGAGFFGRPGSVFNAGRWSNNVRIGTGVVFTFGAI